MSIPTTTAVKGMDLMYSSKYFCHAGVVLIRAITAVPYAGFDRLQ